jgi:hypothetical protein
MPAAIPVPIRQLLAERIARGEPIAAVAADLGLSCWTARTLWRRSRDRGADGLAPDYAACGRPGYRGSPLIARAALTLRRRHPTWGGAPSGRSWPTATPPNRCPTSARCGAGSPPPG